MPTKQKIASHELEAILLVSKPSKLLSTSRLLEKVLKESKITDVPHLDGSHAADVCAFYGDGEKY